jgi:hypothetical protein
VEGFSYLRLKVIRGEVLVEQMREGDRITPQSSARKRRKRSSFRYSTMKELKKAREYKSAKKSTIEPNSVAKTLRYPRRLSKKSDTVIISSPEEVFKTPSPSKVVETVRTVEPESNRGVNPEVRAQYLHCFFIFFCNWTLRFPNVATRARLLIAHRLFGG